MIENICRSFSIFIEKEANKEIAKEPLDAVEICNKFMIDVISTCIFGVEAKSFVKSVEPDIRTMGEQLCHRNFSTRFSSLIFTFFPFLKFLFKNRYVPKKVEKYFVDEVSRVIKEREEDKFDVQDILEYLIGKRNNKEITDFDVTAHIVTFFSDGFETTSTTLAYALYEVWKPNYCSFISFSIIYSYSWVKIQEYRKNFVQKSKQKKANISMKRSIKWFI